MKIHEFLKGSGMDSKDPDTAFRESPEKSQSFLGKFRLQTVLTASIVCVIILAIGITAHFSFQNCQYAISELAGQLQGEVTDRIDQHLDTYLETPHLINALCVDSIRNDELDILDKNQLKRHFQNLTYRFNSSESICFAHEPDGNYTIVSAVGGPGIAQGSDRFWAYSGVFTNYTLDEYRIDGSGQILEKTLSIPEYDPRNRPWYTSAVEAKGPAWSDIYMWLEGVVSVDATVPVYTEDRHLVGVLDTSLTLRGISDFLQNLNISKNGQAFIIDKKGLLVASSTLKEPYSRKNGELVRLSALECNDTIVQGTAYYLKEHFAEYNIIGRQVFSTEIGGIRQFVQVTPYHDEYGLDWLIMVVIPESDFMENIYRNTQTTALLIIFLIIGTISISVLLTRWITEPILSMNMSAKALAKGNWTSWKEIDRQDELGELSHSFKQMAVQLQESFSSLKSSEEQYISLFQFSADAILLLENYLLVNLNQAGEKMFSISGSMATGKDIRELFGNIGSSIAEMIDSNDARQCRVYQEQTVSLYASGDERYINIRLTHVQTAGRNQILVHLRDITDQRRAIISFTEQEALRESYNQVQMILQFLPDPTYVIDINGHVLFWNPAITELTGIKSEEMISSGIFLEHKVIQQYGKPGLINIALDPEIPWEGMYPYIEHSGDAIQTSFWVDINGELKYLSAIAARLYDKYGQVAGAIESIRDITSHKINEESLLIANRKLNLLSSITRHDIQNKVLISKSHVFLLSESVLTNEQKESVAAIDRSMDAIEHFIAFTRTYQELGLKLPSWQDVGETFYQAAEEVESGDVIFNNEVMGIFILADPLLGKVCYNLIENAIRHGEHLTRIDITSRETVEGLRVSVADDGCGIPDDLKEVIFDRGYGKNTGFGLFLVREILSISEITITEHGEFGKGCIFDIDIKKGKFRRG